MSRPEGLRLFQPDRRVWGGILIVPHPRKPAAIKGYHIHIDGTGHAYVTHKVWQRIQESPVEHGFVLANSVYDPPGIHIGLDQAETKRTYELVNQAIKDTTPPGAKVRIGTTHGK